jgi:hypothetical protein
MQNLEIKYKKPTAFALAQRAMEQEKGGLDPWAARGRYRPGCHAQIFFVAGSFEYFFQNQIIKHSIARVIVVWRANAREIRVFIFLSSTVRTAC